MVVASHPCTTGPRHHCSPDEKYPAPSVEGDDNQEYPPAPLPAHERMWRHPSEVGHATWLRTEPPLTIGRGLSAATGAIGLVLAAALLWAVLPTHAGTVTIAAPTTSTPALYQIVDGAGAASHPMAVAISDGALMVTTARAVQPHAAVSLMLDAGVTEQVQLLMVDERDGIALLAHSTSPTHAFNVARSLITGERITFLGDTSATAVVAPDGSIVVNDRARDVPEGTPAMNDRGELVALVTRSSDGIALLPLVGLTVLDDFMALDASASHTTLPAP